MVSKTPRFARSAIIVLIPRATLLNSPVQMEPTVTRKAYKRHLTAHHVNLDITVDRPACLPPQLNVLPAITV